jgi:hypothetical protein
VLERGALAPPFAATDAVIPIVVGDLDANAGGNLAELTLLIGSRLFGSRDAEVKNCPFHRHYSTVLDAVV